MACIAVGDDHALAATEAGALYSWGYGIDGRSGLGLGLGLGLG